jgi:hypothetical protein
MTSINKTTQKMGENVRFQESNSVWHGLATLAERAEQQLAEMQRKDGLHEIAKISAQHHQQNVGAKAGNVHGKHQNKRVAHSLHHVLITERTMVKREVGFK